MSHGVYRPRFALHSSAGGHWQFASASWLLPITWICLLVLHPEGIARSYFIFSIFKNRSMVLHSGCTISHSHQHGTKVPVKFHPQPHVLFAGFYCCCLFWEESCWWGEVVSHFGFDLPYPNVHWCQIFLGLCILSWKKSQIKSFTHFKTGCSLFCWVTGSSLYILDINFVRCMIYKHFLPLHPLHRLPSYSVADHVLSCTW